MFGASFVGCLAEITLKLDAIATELTWLPRAAMPLIHVRDLFHFSEFVMTWLRTRVYTMMSA